ncbi:cell division cycle protein-like protein 23 [Poronia punctata]|nr:cell division cycle protein-like protein 23 [Poronia punctata]
MSLSQSQLLELRIALQLAVVGCSQRCLYHSARWAAELLNALPDDGDDVFGNESEHSVSPQRDRLELLLEKRETPKYLMAKAFFDCHEFQRCAETLLPADPLGVSAVFQKKKKKNPATSLSQGKISQRGLFLASYALLIMGEKQKTEDASQVLGFSDTGSVSNKQLPRIRSVLEDWLARENPKDRTEHGSSEGWLEYIYGMVLAKNQNYHLAKSWLLKSVSLYPWNWGAWQELCCLVRNARDLESIHSELQPSIMAFIFSVYCRQELHQTSASLLSDISQLSNLFPRSSFLQGQKAMVFYRMKDFLSARSIFSEMSISNPMYLDFLDHYSNVLYILNSRDTLAFVAQLASSVDSNRPETCCVIGNYYSLSSRPESAITYFRRALTLDRNCASAWTLLGHEYLRLKNYHAAIAAYLRAVGLNQQDYRAFFGLGQTYEFLGKPNMSLDFYRRALALRPGETDLWQAMAACLVSLSRIPQAISSLERALAYTIDNPNPNNIGDDIKRGRLDLLFQLARVYKEAAGDHFKAKAIDHLKQCLDEAQGTTEEIEIIPKAQLLLAQWALEDGDYMTARYYASLQTEAHHEWKEEAQRILDACNLNEGAGAGAGVE